jgi:hypothetical protein
MNDRILKDIENTKAVHGSARQTVFDIVQSKKFKVGVEIGVQYGLNIEAMLEANIAEKIYGIDPYDTEIYQVSGIKDKSLDEEICQGMLERLSRFGDRFVHIKNTSDGAIDEVPGLVDFVYIDGSKTVAATWNDITYWWPKLREGGVMFIHDYPHISYPHIKFQVDKYFLPLGVVVYQAPGGVGWVEKTRQKYSDRISVVTPFYNTGFWARESLKVALEDERIDDIVIVDDCSIPGETEMLQNAIKDQPKIRYYRNDENIGELKTRIKGAEFAKNEWVIFLDGDNFLTKEYLDKLYMIPHWRQNVIYHPSFGNERHINYTQLEGEYLSKKNISKYINTQLYMISMFLNTGNYFMSKHWYLDCAYKVQETPKHEYGDIVFNNQWLQDMKYIYVVQGMKYVHTLRKNSAWKEHQGTMQGRVNKILDELR